MYIASVFVVVEDTLSVLMFVYLISEMWKRKEKEGNVISFLSLFPGELSPLY